MTVYSPRIVVYSYNSNTWEAVHVYPWLVSKLQTNQGYLRPWVFLGVGVLPDNLKNITKIFKSGDSFIRAQYTLSTLEL